MEKERAEVERMVLVGEDEEEEVVDQDQSGDLETRPRRRKETTDQAAAAAAAAAEEEEEEEEEEVEEEEANSAAELPLENKVEEEGEQRSVYYDQEQGVWKCRHCTWTHGLIGPGRDYAQNHEGNCQLAMDERPLDLLKLFYYSPIKVSLDVAEVAGKKSQEDFEVGTKDQNMNGTINSKHEVSSSLGNIEVDSNSDLKVMKFENGSSSPSYAELYSSKVMKNEDEIQESQEIKVVKISKPKTTEYDLERILTEQDTHDLYCPNCNSCITRRVILRKRKRTVREVQSDTPAKKVHEEEDHAGKLSTSEVSANNEISNQDDDQSPDVFRCLACFSFFIPTEGGYNIFRIFDKREKTLVESSEQLPERRESWFSSFFSSEKSGKRGTESGADITGLDKKSSNSTILSESMTVGKSQSTTQNINGGAALAVEPADDSKWPTRESTEEETPPPVNLIGGATISGKIDSVLTDGDSIITGEQKANIFHKNNQTPSSNISDKAGVEENLTRVTEIIAVLTDGDSIITGEQKANIFHKNNQTPTSNISDKAIVEENLTRVTEIIADTPSHGTSSAEEKRKGKAQYEPNAQITSPSGGIVWLKDQAVVTDASVKIDTDISSPGTSILNVKDKMDGKAQYETSNRITSPSGTVVHFKEQAAVTDVSVEINAGNGIIQHVKKVAQSTKIIRGSGASDATSSLQSEVLIDVSGQSDAEQIERNYEWDVLKSIVYGGLIESITSLGIVSSAAGANASTLNILALGLANLIGGLFLIIHNLFDLRADQDEATDQKDERIGRYWELLGRRKNFRLHLFVAVTSYILFGLLPPVVYSFTFWKSDNKEYKLIAAAASALLCIALLAVGKAHAKKKTYLKTLFDYLSLGVTASGLSYVGGVLIDRLLEELGLFGQNKDASWPPTITYQGVRSTIPAWGSS